MKCRKIHYSTRAKAKAVIKKLRSRGYKNKQRVYMCRYCGGFHLTSADANESKEIREARRNVIQ